MRKCTLVLSSLLLLVLLYFGTHAELGTIQSVTMAVAIVLNGVALGFVITRLPEYIPFDGKPHGDHK